MKKAFSSITSFISKNILAFLICIIIFLLIFYCTTLKIKLDKYTVQKDIRGTFMIVENQMDSEYFVFMDGVFYRYKQFELLDEGVYEKEYDNVYTLRSKNIDECITYFDEKFYFYDRAKNLIIRFSKIDDIPSFINVDIDHK